MTNAPTLNHATDQLAIAIRAEVPPSMTVNEAARAANVSIRTIFRWSADGRIEKIGSGHGAIVRYDRESLIAYLIALRDQSAAKGRKRKGVRG